MEGGSGLSQATAMMLRAVHGRVKYLMAAQRSISSRIRSLEERQGNVILKMVRVFNNRSQGLQEQIWGLERKISVSSNKNYKTLVHALRQIRVLANTTEMLQKQINRIVSIIPTIPPTREHTTMEPFNTAVPTMEPFNTAVPTMEPFNTAEPTEKATLEPSEVYTTEASLYGKCDTGGDGCRSIACASESRCNKLICQWCNNNTCIDENEPCPSTPTLKPLTELTTERTENSGDLEETENDLEDSGDLEEAENDIEDSGISAFAEKLRELFDDEPWW